VIIFGETTQVYATMHLLAVSHVFVDMRVEEEAVHAPREGLRALVHVVVGRHFGEFAPVLFLEVSLMFRVFGLSIANPSKAHSSDGETDVKADSSPKLGCAVSVGTDSFALGKVVAAVGLSVSSGALAGADGGASSRAQDG